MSHGPFLKVTAATAEICTRFDLTKAARLLLDGRMEPREALNALVANKQCVAAIDFVAHALPAREAVWWGCLCVQHACGNDLSAADKAACTAAVQWALEPTEQNRSAATAPADVAGPCSAAGALAGAASQAGDDFAPTKGTSVNRRPFAAAKAVAMAVKLASTMGDPAKIVNTQRRFVELGIGVAEGRFTIPDVRNRAHVRV